MKVIDLSHNKKRQIQSSGPMALDLIKRVFSAPQLHLTKRGIDGRWSYHEKFSMSAGGFNPLTGQIFYPTHSRLDQWLADGFKSDPRKFNDAEDHLIEEVMFVAHDFLHIWAYDQINQIMPSLGFGRKKITPENLEKFSFCHLLTEAVAVVGLDYWYLCNLEIDKIIKMGTNFKALTVSYNISHEDEYRRLYPKIDVQSPDFFQRLAQFYCDGLFIGFNKNDLKISPKIHSWLSHELNYGVNQRIYSRKWLAWLGGLSLTNDKKILEAKVDYSESWQIKLMQELGHRLWSVIKENHPLNISSDYIEKMNWESPPDVNKLNFSFVNFNHLRNFKERDIANWELNSPESFQKWAYQFLAIHDYQSLSPELHVIRKELFQQKRPDLYRYFFKGQKVVPANTHEPYDLFLLG